MSLPPTKSIVFKLLPMFHVQIVSLINQFSPFEQSLSFHQSNYKQYFGIFP